MSLQHCSDEIAVPILVLAPVLKVFKDWIDLVLWVGHQMPANCDVSPIPDLLRQVCGIKDIFWLEKCVLPSLCQEAKVKCQVKISKSFVQKPAKFRNRLEGE